GIGGGEADRVGGGGNGDGERVMAGASQILDRGQQARCQDAQGRIHAAAPIGASMGVMSSAPAAAFSSRLSYSRKEMGLKTTLSPGASRAAPPCCHNETGAPQRRRHPPWGST